MAVDNTVILLLVVVLGILVGIAYSLRRIFNLEKRLNQTEANILRAIKKKKR